MDNKYMDDKYIEELLDENKVYTRIQKNFNFSSDKGIESTEKLLKIFAVVFLGIAIIASVAYLVLAAETPALILGALFFGGFFGFFGGMAVKLLKSINGEYEKFLTYVEEEKKKDQTEREKFLKKHPHWQEEKFFRQMRDEGIENIDSKANIARLKLVTKKLGIKKTQEELIEAFNIGKSETEKFEHKEEMSALKKEERALDTEYNKYIKFVGRKKSEQIIKDSIKECKTIIQECEADEESVRSGGEAFYLANRQKESSWAIHGGIASGIAGGAIGVAAAIDTERRNIEKREQNAKLLQATAALSVMQLEQIWKEKSSAQEKLDFWEVEKELNEKRLIEEVDEWILLSKLNLEVKSFENLSTGSVKIVALTDVSRDFKIYDDEVAAAIDGSIAVSLSVDGTILGTATSVLPYQGVKGKKTIEFICRKVKKQAENYDFIFEPVHLWAVENN